MKYILILILFLQFSVSATAQFDDEEGSSRDRKEKQVDEVETDSPEVGSGDIKKLDQALKDKDEASIIKAASAILAKDSNHLIALNSLAVFHYTKKRYGLSKIILKRAMENHKDEPVLSNNLGVIQLTEGDYRKAMVSFNKALSMDEDYRPSKAQLGAIYLKYGGTEIANEALKSGYKLVKSDLRRGSKFATSVANNYALSLAAVGDGSKAQSVFEDIIDEGSRDPEVYLNYAILLIDVLNKKEKAVKVVSKLKFLTDDRNILKKVNQLDRKLDE